MSECTHPRWRHQIPPPAKQQSAAELLFVRNFEAYGAKWLVSSLRFDGKVVPKVEFLVLDIIHPIQLVLSSPVVGATGRLLNLLLKVTTPQGSLLRHSPNSRLIGRNKTSQDWSDLSCSSLLIGRLPSCYWPADADFESTSPFEAHRLESQEGEMQAPT